MTESQKRRVVFVLAYLLFPFCHLWFWNFANPEETLLGKYVTLLIIQLGAGIFIAFCLIPAMALVDWIKIGRAHV